MGGRTISDNWRLRVAMEKLDALKPNKEILAQVKT